MSIVISNGNLMSLLWSAIFAAALWALVVWALHQDDRISAVVGHLVENRRRVPPATPQAGTPVPVTIGEEKPAD